jgi:1-acyl-sn-glycerol-3-phosphate acyltransferase/acyl carrier protein
VRDEAREAVPDVASVEQALTEAPLAADVLVLRPWGDGVWVLVIPDSDEVERARISNVFEMTRFQVENAGIPLPPSSRPRAITVARSGVRVGDDREATRHEVREALGDEPVRVYPLESPAGAAIPSAWESWIRSWLEIREARAPRRLSRATDLEWDLGLDSLGRLELLCAVWNADAAEEQSAAFDGVRTLGDVVDRAGERPPIVDVEDREASRRRVLASPSTPRPVRRPFASWPLLLLLRASFRRRARKWPVRVVGADDVEWSQRPLIIASNHQSVLDPLLLATHLPPWLHRELVFVGFAGYFSQGKGRLIARLGRIHPIDADAWALCGLRNARAAVDGGRILAIYPEGERTWDGSLRAFRRGVAWLARSCGASVVPSAIAGAYRAMPRGGSSAPHPITIGMRPAIPPPARASDERAWLERLRNEIASLTRELGDDPDAGDPEVWRQLGSSR